MVNMLSEISAFRLAEGRSEVSHIQPWDRQSAIEVHDLTKRYAETTTNAVNGISFTVQRGEIFGLLGPNGAGKTTTIGILTTSVLPTGGSARILGLDVVANAMNVKRHISIVPQQNNLDRSLRAREILTFHGSYHGMPRAAREARADTLLSELNLSDRRNDKVSRFSGGMTQRLMLARALMHAPHILFLDEPTNKLDPQSRLFLWDSIRLLNARGVTVLLTTHDMDEADRLCSRIAIMDHGRILVLGTPAELKKQVSTGSRLELRVRLPALSSADLTQDIGNALRVLPDVVRVEEIAPTKEQEDEYRFHISARDAAALAATAIQVISGYGAELRDLHISHTSLEDVFIQLTGRNLRS